MTFNATLYHKWTALDALIYRLKHPDMRVPSDAEMEGSNGILAYFGVA